MLIVTKILLVTALTVVFELAEPMKEHEEAEKKTYTMTNLEDSH